MRSKIIVAASAIALAVVFWSFRTITQDTLPKTIVITMLNGKDDNNGYIILYGNGKRETRPFPEKLKMLDPSSWVAINMQSADLLNEFREKGYRYAGSHQSVNATMAIVLERE